MNNKISRGDKKNFFSGKGFYVTLAISIIAVGGAAWLGVSSSLDKLADKNDSIAPDTTPSQAVEQKEWDIPVETPKSDENTKKNESAPSVSSNGSSNSNVAQGFCLPLAGDTLNPYSGDKVVKSKTLDEWVMHTGIDIAAEQNTPVKAISGGKVIEVKNDTLWGACVIIEHQNGVESHYYNLKSAISVKKNQSVKLGDVIGAVGTSADIERAEQSHLHLAVKQNGNWIDPMSIIK